MRPQKHPLILVASISAFTALFAGSAIGSTVVLNGTGTNWSVGADWTNQTTSAKGLPQPTDDLLINSSSLSAGFTETLNAPLTVQTLSFDTGSGTLNINANASGTTAQTLTLDGSPGNDALGNATTLLDLSSTTTGTVNIGAAGGVGVTNLVFGTSGIINVSNASAVLNLGANSVISGTGSSILVGGAGTLVLAGANTFGGGGSFFAMNSGTVDINNASALGDAGNLFTIGGGTIDNTSGAAITTSNYAQKWNSDFTFNGTNALNLGAGGVTLGNSVTLTVNGSGANGVLTVGGVISDGGSGYALTKAGNGTLVLMGANTYSGGTTVSSGTLQIGNGVANGSMGAGTYSIGSGARLYFNQGGAPTSPTWANISGSGTLELNDAASANVNYSTLALPAGFTGSLVVDHHGRLQAIPANLGGATSVVINSGAQFLAYDGSGSGTSYTYNQPFSIAGLGVESGHANGALRVSGMNATFAGPITLIGNSGLYTQNSANSTMTVSGVISDGGNGYSLAINNLYTNPITLSGANTYTGATSLNQGALKLSNSLALQSSTLNMAGGTVVFDSSVSASGFTVGGLSGTGNITLADNATTPNPVALTVATNGAATYSGALSGSGSLIMAGTGTQALTGANTYTGTTTINSGTLEVGPTGALTASPITIGPGKLQIDSTGNTLNSLTLNDPGAVLSIAAASGQTTTITNALLQATDYTVTPIFLTAPTVGTINLLTAASISGSGIPTLNLSQYGPTRVTGTLGVSGGNILQLTITSGSANLVWSNGANTGNWNVAGDSNFKNSGSSDVFKSFDAVTFDNTATPGTVTLSGTLAPSAVTVSNASGAYTFSGTGSIVGPGTLTKSGSGTLTIATGNSYFGGTNINGGILNVASAGALGSAGTITFGGGTLQYSAASTTDYSSRFATTASQAYQVDTNGQNVTWAGILTSSGGTLTKSGNGILTLTGANTYSGGTTINSGTLQIGNGSVNGTIGSGTYTIASGARLYLNQGSSPVTPTWAKISGAGTLELNDAASANVNYGQLALPAGFTGSLVIDNRGRPFGNPGNLGAAASVIINGNSQFLAYDGTTGSYTFNQAFSIAGLGSEGGQNYGALRVSVMKATFTGPITLTANSGLYIQNNAGGAMTVSGVISDGGNGYALAINDQNTNPMTLSGQNTYTGATTINSGTLIVSGSISGSTTTVASGATLAGTGIAGPVTVNTGGNITAGATVGSIGTLNTGALSLSGTYKLTLNSTTNQADDLNVTGNLTLSGATLTLTDLALGPGNVNLTIAQFTGSLSGTFSGLAEGALVDGGRYTIDYGISNPHAITLLTVVPEPATYASLLGGLGMLAGLQRFRRRNFVNKL